MKLKFNLYPLSLFQFFIGLFFVIVSFNSNANYLSLTNQTSYKVHFNAVWGTFLCSNNLGYIDPYGSTYIPAGICHLIGIDVTVHKPNGAVLCHSDYDWSYQYIKMLSPTKCYVGPSQ